MYKFSAPMPHTIENINKILDINNQVHKSAITSMYACVPRDSEVFTGFEQSRNVYFNNTSWNYWKKLIEYTMSQGVDFIYLLNSPKPLDIYNQNFPKQIDKLDLLLNELKSIGVNKLRVASPQLMSYIGNKYKDFQIYASTSLEYKTILEYQNFIDFHSEVKQIVPSHDLIKNFKLLKHLIKRNPNIEIELMVNEGCLQGCPNRNIHASSNIDKGKIINNDRNLTAWYAVSFCNQKTNEHPIESLVTGNYIFPWEIEEYKKIGITNFKFVGRDGIIHNFEFYKESYTKYLQAIDNIKSVENCSLADFIHKLHLNPTIKQLSVKKYKKYLPNIKHFIKRGHLCASECGATCNYCYKCAEKMKKAFEKQHATMPICVTYNSSAGIR